MEAKQYRIVKLSFTVKREQFYRLMVTYGLMNTEYIGGVFPRQADARKYAKEHAAKNGWEAIILT